MAPELSQIPGVDLGEIKVEKPAKNVVTSRKANPWLIGLGILLLIAFAGGVYYATDTGSETVEEPTAKTGQSTTTGQDEASSNTTTEKKAPSDTLLTTLLGTGAALIVVGALYGRISTIKLPGGVEIGLSADEKEKTAQKVSEKVKEKAAAGQPIDPAKIAELTQKANDQLLQEKEKRARGGKLEELPDEEISSLVHGVVEPVA